MKKQGLKLVGLIILFVLPLSLMAQDRGQGRSQEDRAARQKEQQDALKKELGLKKDQIVKFDKIQKDYNKKRQESMTAMRDSDDREGMREKMTKMSGENQAAIKKILDKGQLKKYEAYLKKQAEARANRGGRGGGIR